MGQATRILIDHQCPQCGAPTTLEETDRLFACPFCRVKSFLANRDYFRYVLPCPERKDREVVYFPYWRLKGILFSSLDTGIRNRIVDVSYPALASSHFPVSLGLRSQTMKLRFLSAATQGRFLKLDIPLKKMKAVVEQWFLASLQGPVFAQTLIGETPSIIYSPFHVDSGIIDAILNRPVCRDLPENFEIDSLTDNHPDWQIRFVPALCPKCGWDLDGERDSLALHCKNCRILYQASSTGFSQVKVVHFPSEEECVFLPFYEVEASISGLNLKSVEDLVKAANLPKVIRPEWRDLPFHFWSPAFKIRPDDFLRFARGLTLSQPQGERLPGLPNRDFHPVTLSLEEAAHGFKINLASFVKPPGKMLPRLKEVAIEPRKAVLVYIPFLEERNEIRNPEFRLSVNKQLLRFAKHL